jgi:pimeloyl-ACP methyl ester carboxylesterase
VIAGHSQGGQSALWAASMAPRYTSDLKLRGTVAFAPASHLAEQSTALPSLTSPSALTGLAALILRGIDVARPDLGVPGALSDVAAPLYPRTLTECIGPLIVKSSFGTLAPSSLLRPGIDVGPATAALAQLDDPEDLRIRTSVRVQQGTADTTVFKLFTDPLVADYRKRGNPVSYLTYEGVDHGGIVTNAKSANDATKYIRKRLR